jgi:hypothetical protein
MVFNGELRKVQVGGDLFVAQTLRNESDKFALPVSEPKLDAIVSRGNSDFRSQLSSYEFEEELAELRGPNGFSFCATPRIASTISRARPARRSPRGDRCGGATRLPHTNP